MDLEIITLSVINQRQISFDITYLQNRNRLTDIEKNSWLPKEMEEWRKKLGAWD